MGYIHIEYPDGTSETLGEPRTAREILRKDTPRDDPADIGMGDGSNQQRSGDYDGR